MMFSNRLGGFVSVVVAVPSSAVGVGVVDEESIVGVVIGVGCSIVSVGCVVVCPGSTASLFGRASGGGGIVIISVGGVVICGFSGGAESRVSALDTPQANTDNSSAIDRKSLRDSDFVEIENTVLFGFLDL